MHHDAARKIAEILARGGLDPILNAIRAVPHDAFKKRINETHDDGCRYELRPKFSSLCNAARNNGRYGGGESEQEEKLHQVVAIFLRERFCAYKKAHAISHPIAHQKIHHGGHGKIHEDLHQCVDLIFSAHCA